MLLFLSNFSVDSTNDVTLSQQEVDKKNSKNQKKTGVKKMINGGIHKINKVISNFSLQYSQPIYYNWDFKVSEKQKQFAHFICGMQSTDGGWCGQRLLTSCARKTEQTMINSSYLLIEDLQVRIKTCKNK